MTSPPPRFPLFVITLLVVAGSGCTREPSGAEPSAVSAETDTSESVDLRPEAEGPGPERATPRTVFDAANAIFDTLEPPQRPGIEIPDPAPPRTRPQPRPAPTPVPDPAPPPLPPPSPAPPVAGSCDVRGTESYCFTYTGAAWSAASAEEHCDAAPDATYRGAECPAEGRIATCVFRRGEAPSREIVYTYYAPYDLGLARLACPGRFTEE